MLLAVCVVPSLFVMLIVWVRKTRLVYLSNCAAHGHEHCSYCVQREPFLARLSEILSAVN